ncbi:MAG: imidazole glycerol phosphate synthase subunit HisF [Flavobacteriales bacterium]|nr:imidazole glycerol phosphate synthase subunit HisF [Flavobacteriales bacterium]
MLKKRIIPCLDIRNGRTVKGINFENIRDAGNPIELAEIYADQKADELVFLDITATVEERKTFVKLVDEIAKKINIPFTVGGGISSVEDVKALVNSGADKVSINSSAIRNPNLIGEIAKEFGTQCVVVAIDTNYVNNQWKVYTHGGRNETEIHTFDWAKQAENLGAGEILLTSMVHDGTKSGFSIDVLKRLTETVNIPVIASGGAGKKEHFLDVFTQTGVTAALAASIFHFNEIPVVELKKYLVENNIPVRN